MRDLGLMGESIFSLWCADAGLIPNGSQIDKTGWDFFVEFPFSSMNESIEIHKPAIECKVQVKATDKNKRKIQITLSNLRRLITAQMPAFFIFLEFDNLSTAQRAFVVHVDNDLISKVLKKLHSIDQSDKDNKFNSRKMTIHYDDSHLMKETSGTCLKDVLIKHIGDDLSSYVAKKKSFLETTGFEDGFSQLTFTTEGEEDLKKLIDVSIGVEKEVDISVTQATDTRFGIVSKSATFDEDKAKFLMPELKPTSKGVVKFKEEKLSSGLVFESEIFISPFNSMVPKEFRKMRVQGEFFDLKFNPFTGDASYSFSFGEGVRMELRKFRDAVKLITLLSSSGKNLFAELKFEGFPKLDFGVGRKSQEVDLNEELKALEAANNLAKDFEITEPIDISLEEVIKYKLVICQLAGLVEQKPKGFKIEFGIDGDGFDEEKDVACIFLVNAPIGSHILGIIFVVVGPVLKIENDRYRLLASDAIIEHRIISERDETIDNEDLVSLFESVEEKYKSNYSVVTMFDKKC